MSATSCPLGFGIRGGGGIVNYSAVESIKYVDVSHAKDLKKDLLIICVCFINLVKLGNQKYNYYSIKLPR